MMNLFIAETVDLMLMGSLMMEDKQLDFNRPLISVRRPTQTSESESRTRPSDSVTTNKIPPSPPVYKSDIKSGPVRNPGTVPFQWEHKPGKPKDERKKPDSQAFVETHFVPKLPPGRRKPEEARANNQQTKTCGSSSSNVEVAAKSCTSRYDDDSDGTYLDANDTLSRTESFFFNCSNVSGVDGHGMLVEPFGTLSSDRQTQDLMMGRFLPAAKALTSETPPHLARKPLKPEEPARQMLVKKEKQSKAEQNPYRFHHSTEEKEEDGDTSSSVMASGVCGLVPQVCLRTSFGVLNPVPSVRMQAQRAVSVRRMRSKYQDSTTPSNENQNKQNNETVNEDKRKLKLNGSVAQGSSSQGESLSVSSIQEGKEKLENLSAASRTKISKNFGELLASDDNTWKPSSDDHVAEKTLYVDTVHSVDKKVQEESKEKPLFKEYSPQDVVPVKEDVENLVGPGEEKMKVQRDENIVECPDQAIVVAEITKERIDLEQRKATNLESSRLHHRSSYHIVPPPPLPKAPSDSWLKRTLPTIPSKKNSFAWLQSLDTDDNSHFTKIQADPKWETMVKTSNTQQGFVCFSKETLNAIPEA
ncbi:unnamed protein product [Thlaspi arvense]|uniref:Uncharacterized protein n=1 Tax=Thlaspi arvense TaxID=13288 RepID=A0AAU9S7M4_THLAR|nr:unnamed protein product [Thlaspi arvense]